MAGELAATYEDRAIVGGRAEPLEGLSSPEASAEETGLRNSSLQGAYFILALRAQGLDCGPMSGFDADKVDAAFFPDRRCCTNFLLNIGYGDRDRLRARLPPPSRIDAADQLGPAVEHRQSLGGRLRRQGGDHPGDPHVPVALQQVSIFGAAEQGDRQRGWVAAGFRHHLFELG